MLRTAVSGYELTSNRQRPREPNARTVLSAKAPPYKPPPGFEITSIAEKSTASQMLKKSSLKGKQIWYFTAPSSIPISKIEQMSMVDADAGKAILNYEGGDYGFVQDSTGDINYTQIMVPSSSDDAYLTGKTLPKLTGLQVSVLIWRQLLSPSIVSYTCNRSSNYLVLTALMSVFSYLPKQLSPRKSLCVSSQKD